MDGDWADDGYGDAPSFHRRGENPFGPLSEEFDSRDSAQFDEVDEQQLYRDAFTLSEDVVRNPLKVWEVYVQDDHYLRRILAIHWLPDFSAFFEFQEFVDCVLLWSRGYCSVAMDGVQVSQITKRLFPPDSTFIKSSNPAESIAAIQRDLEQTTYSDEQMTGLWKYIFLQYFSQIIDGVLSNAIVSEQERQTLICDGFLPILKCVVRSTVCTDTLEALFAAIQAVAPRLDRETVAERIFRDIILFAFFRARMCMCDISLDGPDNVFYDSYRLFGGISCGDNPMQSLSWSDGSTTPSYANHITQFGAQMHPKAVDRFTFGRELRQTKEVASFLVDHCMQTMAWLGCHDCLPVPVMKNVLFSILARISVERPLHERFLRECLASCTPGRNQDCYGVQDSVEAGIGMVAALRSIAATPSSFSLRHIHGATQPPGVRKQALIYLAQIGTNLASVGELRSAAVQREILEFVEHHFVASPNIADRQFAAELLPALLPIFYFETRVKYLGLAFLKLLKDNFERVRVTTLRLTGLFLSGLLGQQGAPTDRQLRILEKNCIVDLFFRIFYRIVVFYRRARQSDQAKRQEISLAYDPSDVPPEFYRAYLAKKLAKEQARREGGPAQGAPGPPGPARAPGPAGPGGSSVLQAMEQGAPGAQGAPIPAVRSELSLLLAREDGVRRPEGEGAAAAGQAGDEAPADRPGASPGGLSESLPAEASPESGALPRVGSVAGLPVDECNVSTIASGPGLAELSGGPSFPLSSPVLEARGDGPGPFVTLSDGQDNESGVDDTPVPLGGSSGSTLASALASGGALDSEALGPPTSPGPAHAPAPGPAPAPAPATAPRPLAEAARPGLSFGGRPPAGGPAVEMKKNENHFIFDDDLNSPFHIKYLLSPVSLSPLSTVFRGIYLKCVEYIPDVVLALARVPGRRRSLLELVSAGLSPDMPDSPAAGLFSRMPAIFSAFSADPVAQEKLTQMVDRLLSSASCTNQVRQTFLLQYSEIGALSHVYASRMAVHLKNTYYELLAINYRSQYTLHLTEEQGEALTSVYAFTDPQCAVRVEQIYIPRDNSFWDKLRHERRSKLRSDRFVNYQLPDRRAAGQGAPGRGGEAAGATSGAAQSGGSFGAGSPGSLEFYSPPSRAPRNFFTAAGQEDVLSDFNYSTNISLTERTDLIPPVDAAPGQEAPVYKVFYTDLWNERLKLYRTIGPILRLLCEETGKHGFAFGFMSDIVFYSFCDPVVMARNCSARYLALSLTPYLEQCAPMACYPMVVLMDALVSEGEILPGLPGFAELDMITKANLSEFQELCHSFIRPSVASAQLAIRLLHHMARKTTNYTWFSTHFKGILCALADSSTPVQIALVKSVYNLAKGQCPMVYDSLYLDIMGQFLDSEDSSIRGFVDGYFGFAESVLGNLIALQEGPAEGE